MSEIISAIRRSRKIHVIYLDGSGNQRPLVLDPIQAKGDKFVARDVSLDWTSEYEFARCQKVKVL